MMTGGRCIDQMDRFECISNGPVQMSSKELNLHDEGAPCKPRNGGDFPN